MHAPTGGFPDGAQEGTGAAFAVGAGDVDDRGQALFGIAELGQQPVQPIEAEIHQPRVQAREPSEHGVGVVAHPLVTRPPGGPGCATGR